ncbi:hypothetical protein BG006_000502 [Podila minutissima]|uniref:Pirin C-terminal domain-containing protein n=1 Tax=Podila minutissima TaxID=64525 RepID=A0A9P5VHS7_9FUNG|nr:hypothetical protein BG006_000502 [Podila minutissima]
MLASRISHFRSCRPTFGRHVTQSLYATAKPEGVGATIRRSFPVLGFRLHDPFLALDDFAVGPQGGFPDHPHRGFETSVKQPVDEAEYGQDEAVITHGLQLWANLSKKDKMCVPAYQDLRDQAIPRVRPTAGVEIKVIAGASHEVESKIYARTPTMYLDFRMDRNTSVDQAIPKEYVGFVYMVSGKAYFGDKKKTKDGSGEEKDVSTSKTNSNIKTNHRIQEPFEGTEHHSLILSQGGEGSETLHIETKGVPAHFVLFAGLPTGEPSIRSDLFVMNSKEEVQQALEDYRGGKNGFENAKTWRSNIAPKGYRLKF